VNRQKRASFIGDERRERIFARWFFLAIQTFERQPCARSNRSHTLYSRWSCQVFASKKSRRHD